MKKLNNKGFAITTVMIFTIADIILAANGVAISSTIEEYFYKFQKGDTIQQIK